MNWIQLLPILVQLEPLLFQQIVTIITAFQHAPLEVQKSAVAALAGLMATHPSANVGAAA